MFLRCTRRRQDAKLHEYLNVVVNRRLSDARVAQRQVLYLGEINANQREAWRKTVEVQEQATRRQVKLSPAPRCRSMMSMVRYGARRRNSMLRH